jgi:hypothetical protein
MKKLIRKILREEIEKSDRHYRTLDTISKYVELPYFKSMEGLTIYEHDDQEYIMRKILGDDIYIIGVDNMGVDNIYIIYDDKGNEIYKEYYIGSWEKFESDGNDNMVYYENSNGYWSKWEYDGEGYLIYRENSHGDISDNRR